MAHIHTHRHGPFLSSCYFGCCFRSAKHHMHTHHTRTGDDWAPQSLAPWLKFLVKSRRRKEPFSPFGSFFLFFSFLSLPSHPIIHPPSSPYTHTHIRAYTYPSYTPPPPTLSLLCCLADRSNLSKHIEVCFSLHLLWQRYFTFFCHQKENTFFTAQATQEKVRFDLSIQQLWPGNRTWYIRHTDGNGTL